MEARQIEGQMMETTMDEVREREPFGRWLLAQVDRGDAIDALAKAARQDRGFPKNGDPVAVRKRISEQGADPDMHEALDDAELDWAAL